MPSLWTNGKSSSWYSSTISWGANSFCQSMHLVSWTHCSTPLHPIWRLSRCRWGTSPTWNCDCSSFFGSRVLLWFLPQHASQITQSFCGKKRKKNYTFRKPINILKSSCFWYRRKAHMEQQRAVSRSFRLASHLQSSGKLGTTHGSCNASLRITRNPRSQEDGPLAVTVHPTRPTSRGGLLLYPPFWNGRTRAPTVVPARGLSTIFARSNNIIIHNYFASRS